MPTRLKQPQKPLELVRLETSTGCTRTGYRYGSPKPHPKEFYDVFWKRISNHYVVLEEWKNAHKRDTSVLDVRELEQSESSIDQLCLKLLQDKLVGWGLPPEYVQGATIVPAKYLRKS